MATRSSLDKERERVAAAFAALGPGDAEAGYEISSAFAAPIVRRFLGAWTVEEHLVDGEPWIERFVRERLRGATLLDPVYLAGYEWRPALCVKRVSVEGRLETEEGFSSWEYRMVMALGWEPGTTGEIRVRPEIGYQVSSLDGAVTACKDLERSGAELRIRYRFDGPTLVLEEGGDVKRLGKAR